MKPHRLTNNPFLNGAEGEIALFDAVTGRYTVRVVAPRDTVQRCSMAKLLPRNLRVRGEELVAWDIGKEWRDEKGVVCKKNTEFGSLCPRSHALHKHGMSMDACSCLCSVCGDVATAAAMWQCAERCNYRVCDACRVLLQAQLLQPPPAPAHDDGADASFPMMALAPPPHSL